MTAPVPLCRHARRAASCLLCFMESAEGRAILSGTSRWHEPVSTPIDDIRAAMDAALRQSPSPLWPRMWDDVFDSRGTFRRPLFSYTFVAPESEISAKPIAPLAPVNLCDDAPTTSVTDDWLSRMLAAPLPKERAPRRVCPCGCNRIVEDEE